ncbi:MAG: phosphate acetyltransferase [Candidatus Kaelpia imicola]|nr:phosphate acetyltransferase [Candidatus Kaelpia imicola]
MQELIKKASLNPGRIIFPEGDDFRIREAVREIEQRKIARPIIFIEQDNADDLEGIDIVNPKDKGMIEKYVDIYSDLRKNKNIAKDKIKNLLESNSVFIAALMVREGLADAVIAGAAYTTKDVARAVIHCIGVRDGSFVSSCFLMDTGIEEFGYKGKFIFADCGIIFSPDFKQLADIAINSGDLFKSLFKKEPYIAFLSYSSHGSASGESIEKIRAAVSLVKKRRPDLNVDGEMQGDAAIVKAVADIKCSDSPVAGHANVLIFPDLNSGNICYKLVDRLTSANALGPIFLGTRYPCSDLSRGCEAEEIVLDAAVISIMAQLNKQ